MTPFKCFAASSGSGSGGSKSYEFNFESIKSTADGHYDSATIDIPDGSPNSILITFSNDGYTAHPEGWSLTNQTANLTLTQGQSQSLGITDNGSNNSTSGTISLSGSTITYSYYETCSSVPTSSWSSSCWIYFTLIAYF